MLLIILACILYIISIFISIGIMVEKEINPDLLSVAIVICPILNSLFVLYHIFFKREIFNGWVFTELFKFK